MDTDDVVAGGEAPAYFLCPISLQLMRDPVTVSTGITYDRSSIEKWIFSLRNTTCPVTKQLLILPDTDVVTHLVVMIPNLILRRLIQTWSQSNESHHDDDDEPNYCSTEASYIKPEITDLISILRDNDPILSYTASLSSLKILSESFSGAGGIRNRVKAVEAGAMPVIIWLLNGTKLGEDKRCCEMLLKVLGRLCGCAEGRADLLAHPEGLAAVAKKMVGFSWVASDRAVRVIEKVCRFSGTDRVLREMEVVGVVAGLRAVAAAVEIGRRGGRGGGDGLVRMKERAGEMLRLYSRVWKGFS